VAETGEAVAWVQARMTAVESFSTSFLALKAELPVVRTFSSHLNSKYQEI